GKGQCPVKLRFNYPFAAAVDVSPFIALWDSRQPFGKSIGMGSFDAAHPFSLRIEVRIMALILYQRRPISKIICPIEDGLNCLSAICRNVPPISTHSVQAH